MTDTAADITEVEDTLVGTLAWLARLEGVLVDHAGTTVANAINMQWTISSRATATLDAEFGAVGVPSEYHAFAVVAPDGEIVAQAVKETTTAVPPWTLRRQTLTIEWTA